MHGYVIAQRIQLGSLYPALYRLEERGDIQAQWRETDQGRMAKFYSVTKKAPGSPRLQFILFVQQAF